MRYMILRNVIFWSTMCVAFAMLALIIAKAQPEVVELCSIDGGANFGPCS